MDRIAMVLHIVGWMLLMVAAPSCTGESPYRALRRARRTVVGSGLDSGMNSYLEMSFKKLESAIWSRP